MTVRILNGDVIARLRDISNESIDCIVTSPPYFGLRDYKIEPSVWGGDAQCSHVWMDSSWVDRRNSNKIKSSHLQNSNRGSLGHQIDGLSCESAMCSQCGAWLGCLGMEATPQLFIDHLVMVFREVRRVLRDDGVLWLNLGDSYAGSWGAQGHRVTPETLHRDRIKNHPRLATKTGTVRGEGLKPKDLMGVPWRIAFALQSDGWWLRQWLPWVKRNPMPESVKDRPTVACETIFMLTKSERYFYDVEAVKRAASPKTNARVSQDVASQTGSWRGNNGQRRGDRPMKAVISRPKGVKPDGRNRANESFENATCQEVLSRRYLRQSDLFYDSLDPAHGLISDMDGNPLALDVTTQPYKGAHFATFPPKLVEPLIRAACPEGGTVLDPFGGAGTTGLVADRLQRNAILIERSPENVELARERIEGDSAGPLDHTEVIVC